MTVEVTDLGMSQILANLKALDGVKLVVGIQGPEGGAIHPDGELDNVTIGLIHEFGAPGANIPARPFIRSTFDAKEKEWTKTIATIAERVYSSTPTNPGRALGILGEVVVSDIQKTIAAGIPPELEESTIKARVRQFGKASTTPLIATGILRQSITWTIRK
jgi:hypothetical protein